MPVPALAATVSSTPGYLARGLYIIRLWVNLLWIPRELTFVCSFSSMQMRMYLKMLSFIHVWQWRKHMNRWATLKGQSSPLLMDVYSADGYGYTNQGPVMMVEKALCWIWLFPTQVVVDFRTYPNNRWTSCSKLGWSCTHGNVSNVVLQRTFGWLCFNFYKLDQYLPSAHKLAVRAIYTPFGSMNIGSSS